MEINERNTIIALTSIIIGVVLSIYVIPFLINLVLSENPLVYFRTSIGYIHIDLIILAMTLFLYAYFLIKPVKTIRGKKNLGLGAIILGGILILFPAIAIGIDFIFYFTYYFIIFYFLIFDLLVLLPGVALFVHGWYIKRSTVSEER